MKPLSKRLREVRASDSQQAMAKRLGINVNTWRHYELGDRIPNADVLLSVSDLCHINLEWLLRGEGPMYRTQAAGGADQEQPQQRPPAPPAPESELDYLRGENQDLRKECQSLREENKDLRQENRALAQENKHLVDQNAELRIEVQKLKPDPDVTYEDDMQRSA